VDFCLRCVMRSLSKRAIVLQLHEDLPVGVRPDIGVNLEALDSRKYWCEDSPIPKGASCVDSTRSREIESERGIAVRIAARERKCTSDRRAAPFAAPDRQARTNLPGQRFQMNTRSFWSGICARHVVILGAGPPWRRQADGTREEQAPPHLSRRAT